MSVLVLKMTVYNITHSQACRLLIRCQNLANAIIRTCFWVPNEMDAFLDMGKVLLSHSVCIIGCITSMLNDVRMHLFQKLSN